MKQRPNTQNVFLLVNRDLLWPKARRWLSNGCWIYYQCWSKSEISRFPVTSEESWSQGQWSCGVLGSFGGRTGGLQRWAPSRGRGKDQQTEALGVWTGTKSWRAEDRLVTHFGAHRQSTRSWCDSLRFNELGISSKSHSLCSLSSWETWKEVCHTWYLPLKGYLDSFYKLGDTFKCISSLPKINDTWLTPANDSCFILISRAQCLTSG